MLSEYFDSYSILFLFTFDIFINHVPTLYNLGCISVYVQGAGKAGNFVNLSLVSSHLDIIMGWCLTETRGTMSLHMITTNQ